MLSPHQAEWNACLYTNTALTVGPPLAAHYNQSRGDRGQADASEKTQEVHVISIPDSNTVHGS